MAGSLNKVTLIGNLGKDPEIRYTTDGKAIANITVATNESWKDKNTGEKQEKTEWHRVSFFGRLAEVVGEYLRKGSKVYIEGSLQPRKWQDKEGQDRYTTEVIVSGFGGSMIMLDSKGGGQYSEPAANQGHTAPPASTPAKQPPPAMADDFDDDIPF